MIGYYKEEYEEMLYKEECEEQDPNWELFQQDMKFARKHYRSPVKVQNVVQSVTRKQKRFPQKIR